MGVIPSQADSALGAELRTFRKSVGNLCNILEEISFLVINDNFSHYIKNNQTELAATINTAATKNLRAKRRSPCKKE